MPRWVVSCPKCSREITHSEIATKSRTSMLDPFASFDDKPELPGSGVKLECPSCKEVSVYKRYQLTYRAN